MGFSTIIDNALKLRRRISKISEKDGDNCVIQLLNADGIAGEKHILHATVHAINAFKRNENIANDIGLEICVRASAQRQISKALNILGIKNGEMNICAVLVNCEGEVMSMLKEIMGDVDNTVLKPDNAILKDIYGISDDEIKTAKGISNVMIERTTLLLLDH